jgi:hypothetical protein
VFVADPGLRPVRRRDGYLALDDVGVISAGVTPARATA